jgi:outer membrane receptor protein involved in Fe transport
VRGAGAGPYGAGALTGVIALRERDEGGAFDASVSEDGGRRLAAATTLKSGRVAITGSVLYDQPATAMSPCAVRPPAPPTRRWISRSAAPPCAPICPSTTDRRLPARLRLRRGSRLRSAGARLRPAVRQPVGDRRRPALAPTGLGWRLQVWRRESDLANTSVAVAADRATTTPANDQYETPATGWGVNAALRQIASATIGGRMEWELGADARFAEGETHERFSYMPRSTASPATDTPGARPRWSGLYVEGSWTGGLVAGRRRPAPGSAGRTRTVTGWSSTGPPALPCSTRPSPTGRARWSARVWPCVGIWDPGSQALRAAAYSGFRPATLNELHRPFRVGNDLTEANAALEPEKLSGVETGLSWTTIRPRLRRHRCSGTASRTPSSMSPSGQDPASPRPAQGFVPAGGVLRQRQNAGTIEATGIELNAEQRLDRVTLTAAVSWTDAELDGGSAAPQLTGLRPAQAPEWSATAGIDWRTTERLTLSSRARYETARFDDDLNSRTLDAALTLDARADYRLRDGVTLYAAADNLFDEDVAVSQTGDGVVGYGPPRTMRAGVSLRW